MNEKIVTLPISLYKVTLRTRIPYGTYKEIEGEMLKGTKGRMVGKELEQSFDAYASTAYEKKMIESFIVSATDDAGNTVQINLLLGTSLDMEDGIFLENEVKEIYSELKKRLKTPTIE